MLQRRLESTSSTATSLSLLLLPACAKILDHPRPPRPTTEKYQPTRVVHGPSSFEDAGFLARETDLSWWSSNSDQWVPVGTQGEVILFPNPPGTYYIGP